MRSRSMILGSLILVAAFGMTGCGSDNNVLAPQFEPEVTNQTDSFALQSTDFTKINQSLLYTWTNTGTQANIDQSCVTDPGAATLIVKDAQGTTVYTRDMTEDGSFQTQSGVAGDWTIRVVLNNATGTLNFSLQKTT